MTRIFASGDGASRDFPSIYFVADGNLRRERL